MSRRFVLLLISSRSAWALAMTRLLATDCSRWWLMEMSAPATATSPTEINPSAPTTSTSVNPAEPRVCFLFIFRKCAPTQGKLLSSFYSQTFHRGGRQSTCRIGGDGESKHYQEDGKSGPPAAVCAREECQESRHDFRSRQRP